MLRPRRKTPRNFQTGAQPEQFDASARETRDCPGETRAQVTRLMGTCLHALATADTNLLGQVFTANYFRNHGGLDDWARRLPQLAGQYRDVSVAETVVVAHRSKPNFIWAQFALKRGAIVEPPPSDSWFLLVQDPPGTWRIDEHHSDYDPRHPGERP